MSLANGMSYIWDGWTGDLINSLNIRRERDAFVERIADHHKHFLKLEPLRYTDQVSHNAITHRFEDEPLHPEHIW